MRRQPATPAPAPGAESGLAAVVTSVLESPHAMLIVAGGLLLTFLAFITVNVAICGFIYLRNSKRGAAEEEEEEERPYRATKASYKPYKPPKRTKPAPKPASSDDASSEDEPAPAPRKPQGKPLPPIAAPIPQGKAPTKGKAKAKETPRGGKELWQAAAQAAKLEVSATASSEEKMASSSDKLLNLWTKTIDNAMEAHQKRNSEIKQLSPQELLDDLKRGNTRFWTGAAERPEMDATARRALIHEQVPKVAVLGCADSRVPIEIVLDQGLGDVFVSRNAGNLYGDKVAGTIDYAVHHLGIKLVVVMGHQGCGAVKASRLPREDINKEPKCLKKMLISMKDSLEYCSETLDNMADANARDREAVIANAQAQVTKMLADPLMKKKVDAGNLIIVAAFYEITSGIVDFIEPLES